MNMVRATKWSKEDFRFSMQLAGIFVAIGAVLGLLRGDGLVGLVVGAFAGAVGGASTSLPMGSGASHTSKRPI